MLERYERSAPHAIIAICRSRHIAEIAYAENAMSDTHHMLGRHMPESLCVPDRTSQCDAFATCSNAMVSGDFSHRAKIAHNVTFGAPRRIRHIRVANTPHPQKASASGILARAKNATTERQIGRVRFSVPNATFGTHGIFGAPQSLLCISSQCISLSRVSLSCITLSCMAVSSRCRQTNARGCVRQCQTKPNMLCSTLATFLCPTPHIFTFPQVDGLTR